MDSLGAPNAVPFSMTAVRSIPGNGTSAFAGEGDQEVVPAVIATDSRKAVGKDAAFKIFVKR